MITKIIRIVGTVLMIFGLIGIVGNTIGLLSSGFHGGYGGTLILCIIIFIVGTVVRKKAKK
ncbi:hypothetical protein SAMN06296386_11212 [Lachnospiraceae bacterium]|nr:hypothetical protein SAMN06296386_11212 [Lachnospiraceae bacterium]